MFAATLTVGNVEITAILDVDTSIPLVEVFDGSGDAPPGGAESLAARYPNEFTADSWRFRDHCFLVRTPERLTLIDTGAGPVGSAFGRWLGIGGTLSEQLAALGVVPGDVDDVILTHVHSDHTGWSTMLSSNGWVPRFSNAQYYLHDADVAWMRGFVDEENVREFAEAIAPLESAGQLKTSIEDREVSPGLRLQHAPGHTPGHRCVLLDTGGERVLFAGDLLHFTFQLNEPGFRSPGDDDPEEGSRTRTAWLDRAESEGFTLATAHVPPSPIGRIIREGGLRLLQPRS
jgi:glyoxylase-like metal-dependent hydrolase (beta-lactamase superfamily II)